MLVCASCGRENADDARFCSACGAQLTSESPREQRKVVTVLFCDLVGSTALGESTDPEALRARMRRYFEDLRTILERHGGTVEKFVGDAVMAVFGIPVSHEDDALRAVRAALEMRAAIADHGLEARIGVNTGEVVVGGEGETLVTGDAVNVAARLEQAAGSGEILIGPETRLLVRDAVHVDAVDPLALKGKSEPVEAFLLLGVLDTPPVARHLDTPLVGRERERQRLWRDHEDTITDNTCRLFTLLGPAGIGKSRLVADFLERVGDSADVLRGRCLSYGEGITYWPLVEMLVAIGVEPQSIVASTPEETRVAFRRLLEGRAAQRPQVVVVDDLQWAEPTFVDLVEHVADLSRNAPIFLLCIARTELLELRPYWGGGKLNASSLLLEPLDADECSELMQLLAPGDRLDPELSARITAASAGNPLFVEEMLAMVRERGADDVAVPPTIQALLQARIDGLDSDLRVVLECAAVEGEVFHRDAVDTLVPPELRSEVDERLGGLVRAELVRPEASLIPGASAFRFRHLLIREAAYAAMPKERRAGLHETFANWLEGSPTSSAFELDEILGYHFEQAYRFRSELGLATDPDLAARGAARLAAAGRGALRRADFAAAAGLLQRALDLQSDPMRPETSADLAQALVPRGELERAKAVLTSALEEAGQAGDERIEARVRLMLGSLRSRIDADATVEDELRQALEIAAFLEREGDLPTLSRAYARAGMCRFQLGHGAEGEVDLRRAAEIARRAGNAQLERAALTASLRPMAWGPTPATEGVDFCTSLVESAVTTAADKAHALQVRALFQAMQGDVDEARRSSSDAWSLIEEYELTLLEGLYAADVGFAEEVIGDLERAEQVLRRGHDVLLQIGDLGVRSTVDGILGNVLFLLGRDDEALALAEASRTIAVADDFDAQLRWRAVKARVVSRRGDQDEALELLREALKLADPIDFIGLKAHVEDVHGEVLAHAGRLDEAALAVGRAVSLNERKGNVVSARRSQAVLDELRATRRS